MSPEEAARIVREGREYTIEHFGHRKPEEGFVGRYNVVVFYEAVDCLAASVPALVSAGEALAAELELADRRFHEFKPEMPEKCHVDDLLAEWRRVSGLEGNKE